MYCQGPTKQKTGLSLVATGSENVAYKGCKIHVRGENTLPGD